MGTMRGSTVRSWRIRFFDLLGIQHPHVALHGRAKVSTSAHRSQVEDRSTAIEVAVSGLEFQGFGFGRVNGYYGVHTADEVLGRDKPTGCQSY